MVSSLTADEKLLLQGQEFQAGAHTELNSAWAAYRGGWVVST